MARLREPKKPQKEHSYAVEKILRSRLNSRGQHEYLIQWKDRPESENSWQLVDDLFSKAKASPAANAIDTSPMDVDIPNDSNDENDKPNDSNDLLEQALGTSHSDSGLHKESDEGSSSNENERVEHRSKSRRAEKVPKEQEVQASAKKSRYPNRKVIDDAEQAPPAEAPEPPKRRRRQATVPDEAGQTESNSSNREAKQSNTDADAGPAETAAAAAAERTIKEVQTIRKRNNRHEYLVTWTTGAEDEWISSDIMKNQYAQHLIAYFERIIKFR